MQPAGTRAHGVRTKEPDRQKVAGDWKRVGKEQSWRTNDMDEGLRRTVCPETSQRESMQYTMSTPDFRLPQSGHDGQVPDTWFQGGKHKQNGVVREA